MLPHELFYITFLATTFIRLLIHSSNSWIEAGITGLILLLSLWLILSRETKKKKWMKQVIPILSVPFFYFSLKRVVSVLCVQRQDALLQKADFFLLGGNLSLKTRLFVHPLLTEFMYICYMLFFAYVIFSLWQNLKKDEITIASFYSGLFSIYWIGFLFYTIVPADGPYLSMRDVLGEPLKEGLLFAQPICELIYRASNRTDVFPSLHCSISAYCLLFDWVHHRRRFWLFLPLCLAIWISTIYLSYHYFVDILAGFFLTFFAFALAKRIYSKGRVLSPHIFSEKRSGATRT
jgi:membrane-associated phospholipid phosphatase